MSTSEEKGINSLFGLIIAFLAASFAFSFPFYVAMTRDPYELNIFA